MQDQPVEGVSAGIVDTVGQPGKRFPNMNGFYGRPASSHPKARRAAEVLRENRLYDKVLDYHGRIWSGGIDYAWVNSRRNISGSMLGFLASVGIDTLLDSRDVTTMLTFTNDACLLEIGPSGVRDNPAYWRGPLEQFARGDVPLADPRDFRWYRFAGDVTHKQRERLKLPQHIDDFGSFAAREADRLGFPDQEVVALVWDAPGAVYCGEIAVKTSVPDAVMADMVWQARRCSR